MENKIIQSRKNFSQIMNESKRRAKRQECFWCGEKITRFCNSHSVPEFILKNIDCNGKLDCFNTIINLPFINIEKGRNEAGTFKLLCRECDGQIFQDYEDENKLRNIPPNRMLAEIAVKNDLVMLNKRFIEQELYGLLEEKKPTISFSQTKEAIDLDKKDFLYDYERAKKAVKTNEEDSFELIVWKELDYVIPIAFQGSITLYGDLEGNLVTDLYDKSEDVFVPHFHICFFPLSNSSVVFAFYNKEDHEYDRFAEQLKSLDEDKMLITLSYIVFAYNEEIYIAPKFPHRTWMLKQMENVCYENTTISARSTFEIAMNLLQQ